jgi:hypothetical protein
MAQSRKYGSPMISLTYREAVAVTPSDNTSLTLVADALYIGGTGQVTLVTQGGSTVAFSAVPAGTVLPVSASRVNNTATNATAIVALYL